MLDVGINFREGSRDNLVDSGHSFYLIWLLGIKLKISLLVQKREVLYCWQQDSEIIQQIIDNSTESSPKRLKREPSYVSTAWVGDLA